MPGENSSRNSNATCMFTRIGRPLSWMAQSMNALGTLVVLVLVVVVNGDAISRNVFNSPFLGIVEAVQFSMVLIVFMQLPDVVRVNRLTRSDGFLAVMAASRPGVARQMARVIDLMSAAFMAMIAYTMYPEFIETLHNGRYIGVPGIFTMPLWPTNLAITVSALLCTALFLLKAITGKRRPELLHLEESGA